MKIGLSVTEWATLIFMNAAIAVLAIIAIPGHDSTKKGTETKASIKSKNIISNGNNSDKVYSETNGNNLNTPREAGK